MRTPSAFVRRTGALLAASSAVLHGAALGPTVTPWVAVLTVAVLVGCLYCAYELLTRDTLPGWVLVAVMNLAMVAVHLPMTGAHHHGGGAAVIPGAVSTAMELATAVAIVEVLLAATVLLVRTRALAPVVVASCQSGDHDSGGSTGRSAPTALTSWR